MPTYQYACTECGGQLEVVQKFSDDPLTVHEACGGKLRKVFSPVGIVFKGSGFYRTDSRNGKDSAASSSSPAESASSDKTPAKSEAGSSSSAAGESKSSAADKPAASPAPAKAAEKVA